MFYEDQKRMPVKVKPAYSCVVLFKKVWRKYCCLYIALSFEEMAQQLVPIPRQYCASRSDFTPHEVACSLIEVLGTGAIMLYVKTVKCP